MGSVSPSEDYTPTNPRPFPYSQRYDTVVKSSPPPSLRHAHGDIGNPSNSSQCQQRCAKCQPRLHPSLRTTACIAVPAARVNGNDHTFCLPSDSRMSIYLDLFIFPIHPHQRPNHSESSAPSISTSATPSSPEPNLSHLACRRRRRLCVYPSLTTPSASSSPTYSAVVTHRYGPAMSAILSFSGTRTAIYGRRFGSRWCQCRLASLRCCVYGVASPWSDVACAKTVSARRRRMLAAGPSSPPLSDNELHSRLHFLTGVPVLPCLLCGGPFCSLRMSMYPHPSFNSLMARIIIPGYSLRAHIAFALIGLRIQLQLPDTMPP
ncbi:hypothetical protein C8F01DRAFT_1261915 [Mycena amicta]|nr:hypothetical protein C8F01DRAFT_1261915 [Mycena amicta]